MMTPSYDRITELIILYIQGTIDGNGQRELDHWVESSPENAGIFRKLTSDGFFEENAADFFKGAGSLESNWAGIIRRIVPRRKKPVRKMLRYAAIFLLPVAAALLFYNIWPSDPDGCVLTDSGISPGLIEAILILPDGNHVILKEDTHRYDILEGAPAGVYENVSGESEVVYHTLKLPRGREYTVVLADGTVVRINSESELRYPTSFTGGLREVELRGEAFFEVAKDPGHPFVVHTPTVSVRVLGTSFGVRAIADEVTTLTTLVSGAVEVYTEKQSRRLNPGEQLIYDKYSEKLRVENVNLEEYVGWKDGRLVFDNRPLEFVMAELGRWYSFDVEYVRLELRNMAISLNVKKHDDFAKVLQLLKYTGKIDFDIKNNKVMVK